MSGSTRTDGAALSPEVQQRMKCVRERFEEACKRSPGPRIEDYLAGVAEPERSMLLHQLIRAEVSCRLSRGEELRVQEYQKRFPALDRDWLAGALAVPASPTLPADRAASKRRTEQPTVPGYEILGELNRGGMGVVYKAWQVKLNRVVALKMILGGAHASAEDRSRFHLEAEAVGRLQHANIVQIHDHGEHNGSPYIALEYLGGGGLDCKLNRTPQPPRAAAQMVETLAQTIHYAHQHGIIHRDLKPSNVLLTKEGAPKIVDFGVAKLLVGGAGLTRSSQILGTPGYMAPEQASGNHKAVGPAADVYGLGVILYEMLTGRAPFSGAVKSDILERVCTEEPLPPRRLEPLTPRDLDTICLKCLAKEPGRRYASAQHLADDLKRFLDGEPIRARAMGQVERLGRWIKRNLLETALLAAIVLIASAVVVIVLGQIHNARLQALGEQLARQNAKLQRVRELHFEIVGSLAGVDSLHKEAILKKYRAFVEQLEERTVSREALAEACEEWGTVARSFGDQSVAMAAYTRAQEIYEQLAGEQPDRLDYLGKPGRLQVKRGMILVDFRDWSAAESAFNGAVARLTVLQQQHPGELDYQLSLAEAYHNLGVLHDSRDGAEKESDWEKALGYHKKAKDLREEIVHRQPTNVSCRRDLARSCGFMGDVQLELGQTDKALASFQTALKEREQIVKQAPNDDEARYQLNRSSFNMVDYYRWVGDPQRALEAAESLWQAQTALAAEHPALMDYARDLGWTACTIAELRLDAGEAARASETLEQARSLFEKLVEKEPRNSSLISDLAQTYVDFAKLHIQRNQPEAAREALRMARARLEGLTRKQDNSDIYNLALVHALSGELGTPGRAGGEYHARKAVGLLGQAVQKGYRNVELLKRDIGFRSLWEREDFKGLVKDLEAKWKAGGR